MDSDISGAAMDTAIAPNPWKKRLPVIFGIAAILALLGFAVTREGGNTLSIARSQITVSAVSQGTFENYIPIRPVTYPRQSLVVDALRGGKVKEILAQNGDIVEQGQVLLTLYSFDHELNVMDKRNTANRQLGELQKQRVDLDIQLMDRKAALANTEYDLKQLEQELNRKRQLAETGDVSGAQLNDLEARYTLKNEQYELSLERQKKFEDGIAIQLEKFDLLEQGYNQDLNTADVLEDAMNIRAPIAGRVSGLSAELGENIGQGTVLAYINSPREMKLQTNLPEQYINRIELGQKAELELEGEIQKAYLGRINPDIVDGQFEVDLFFEADTPAGISKGRTLAGRLYLSEPRPALLLGNGSFINETGGNWAFVLNEQGSVAEKRQITLGDQNLRYIEVLAGLQTGDQVVVSSYGDFINRERLELKD